MRYRAAPHASWPPPAAVAAAAATAGVVASFQGMQVAEGRQLPKLLTNLRRVYAMARWWI